MAPKKDSKKKLVGTVGKSARSLDGLITSQDPKRKTMFRATEAPHKIRTRIPTSSLVINRQLGGGVAIPRITQFYGPSGVFKSTGVYDLIGNAQAMGMQAVLFDTEDAASEPYLRQWGIDPYELGLGGWVEEPAPDGGVKRRKMSADESVEQIIDLLREDSPPELIVVDSLTGWVTDREIEKGKRGKDRGATSFIDTQNKLQGWNGKFNSIAFKHINQANRGTTALVFTNQMRDTLGDIVRAARNQGKTKPTGGHAPRYYSSDIIYLEHSSAEFEDDGKLHNIPVGSKVRQRKKFGGWMIECAVEKSRTTSNVNSELFFTFNPRTSKIDKIGEVIDLARIDGLLTTKGSYYYVGEQKLGQGLAQVRQQLRESQSRFEHALANGEQPDAGEIFVTLCSKITAKSEMLGQVEG